MITVWRNLREGGTLLGLPLTVWRIWNWIFCGSTGYWASGYILSLLELTFLQMGLCLSCERRQYGSPLCDSRDYIPTKCDYGSAEATTSSSTRVQATSRMDVLKK
ncbi:uncharacterized protein LOC110868521 isoform X2 [Helianthus annuus]|uniref:uncharacterized protein LOC110868521 isoform X2 n=1 Tax=Helianthus annuus TaxID=4232 RepID=UPI000B8EF701|nr:uncharacterized protein LOC110868521 isoform X2 [Helianthus annuus]